MLAGGGKPDMASSCIRGGLDCILGKITERVVKHWNRMCREAFKKPVDMALQDIV